MDRNMKYLIHGVGTILIVCSLIVLALTLDDSRGSVFLVVISIISGCVLGALTEGPDDD